ncbi:MAG: DUF2442 domain-containing protein [Pedosphaera sp.]|nr:DUF2442 domain-containing protein [Pedosphaera sp.]
MSDVEIEKVHFTQDRLGLELKDVRLISVPLSFYPTLQNASEAQRLNFELSPSSVHWPDLDCDIGVEGMLAGAGELSVYAQRSTELHALRDAKAEDTSAPGMTLAEVKLRYGIKQPLFQKFRNRGTSSASLHEVHPMHRQDYEFASTTCTSK